MITDTAEWAILLASASGTRPATPEGKRAWKAVRGQVTEEDGDHLATLAASGSEQERMAALWVLSFGVVASLATDPSRPRLVRRLEESLHQAPLLSDQWLLARNCLYDLEAEPDPVDEDLRLRGLTREDYRRMEEDLKKAELAARLPPAVDVEAAVESLVASDPWPAPTDLAERLRGAAHAWRDREDHHGLDTVFQYVVNLPEGSVSYAKVVALLGPPKEFDTSRAYYGDSNRGLVIVANAQGTIDSVKFN
jgi:hypothetical protein